MKTSWGIVLLYAWGSFAGFRENAPETASMIWGIALIFIAALMIAALAIVMHRKCLLPTQDQALATADRRAMVKTYAWRWALMILPLFVVGIAVFLLWFLPSHSEDADLVDISGENPFLSPAFQFAANAMIAVLMWVFYRIALGLPHLACGQGWLNWSESWAATAPMSGQIAFLSLIATAVPYAVDTAVMSVIVAPSGWSAILYDVVYMIVSTIVGAAMLTQIYLRAFPAAANED